ncbi:MAG: hypothetical protein AAB480_00765 [Patescibacteria group bacterium]
MFDLKKNPLLIPSILFFLAAVIFAWAVTMARAPRQTSSAQSEPQVQTQARPQLLAGTPNPADSLPQLGAAAVTGKVTAVDANSVTIQAGVLGAQAAPSTTFQTDAKTVIYARGASKEPALYKKEMQDFLAKLAYADPDSPNIYRAPEPYEHAALRFADLKTGALVTVTPTTADPETAATIFVAAQL